MKSSHWRLITAGIAVCGVAAFYAMPAVLAGQSPNATVEAEADQPAGAGHRAYQDEDGNRIAKPEGAKAPAAAPSAPKAGAAVKSNIGGFGVKNTMVNYSYAVVNPDGGIDVKCKRVAIEDAENGTVDISDGHTCSSSCAAHTLEADGE